jgi:membrane-bound lytic murein transglycosylase C
MKNMYKSIKTKTPKIQRYKNNNIYKITLKLPSNTKIKKAQIYQKDVNSNSSKQKIPAELIYAIIDSESSFNPMARSVIPAYGLMQIVPQTAGIDSYYFLYNRKKAPTANFLYNTNKNITIGTAYLHLLYFKYLNDIKDPMSKLYCVVSAYNTGAGNVSKAFIGNTNINKAIKKINSMDSDSVYKHLLRNLPYNETRAYLKKVVDKTSGYYKLIKQNKL